MKNELKIFFTFLLVFSLFVHWSTWNEQSRFALTRAIVDEARFEIDSFFNVTGYRLYYKNHYYCDKHPGLSFISTFIYFFWRIGKEIHVNYYLPYKVQVFDKMVTFLYPIYDSETQFFLWLLTIFSSSIFIALTSVIIFKFAKGIGCNEKDSIFIALTMGFATILFHVAIVYWDHAIATFLVFLSFHLLYFRKSSPFIFLSGLLLGFSISSHIYSLVFLLGFPFYMVLKKYRYNLFLSFFLGLSIGLLPILLYNYLLFDNFSIRIPILELVDKQIWELNLKDVWIISTPFIVVVLNEFIIFRTFFVIIKLLFFPERGLFFYSPILFLFFPLIFYSWKKFKAEIKLVLFLFFLFILGLAWKFFWFSGITFGQRDFSTLIPFMFLPFIFSFEKIKRKKVVYFLVGLSVFINFLGLQCLECLSLNSPATDLNPSNFLPNLNKFEDFYSGKNLSYSVLKNPVFEYYFPLFLRNGPRSKVFESIVNSISEKKFSMNVSYNAHLRPIDEVSSKFYKKMIYSNPFPSFISLIFLSLFLIFLWRKEIFNKNSKLN